MSVPTRTRSFALIDQEELVKLALDLANIDSPPGHEKPVSDYVYSWLRENGFAAAQIALVPERPNVVGRLSGSGGGFDLIFNAHMDVAWGPDERRWMHDPDNPFYVSAWREGETLIGNGLVNDKGPLACTLIAAKAVKEAGVPLLGDLIVTGVCGEIGQEPVDEFAAPEFLSKEVGTRYLVTHGVIGDFAVVAEATDFGLTWVEAGKAFFKITVLGGSSRYTPYIDHPESLADNQNAVGPRHAGDRASRAVGAALSRGAHVPLRRRHMHPQGQSRRRAGRTAVHPDRHRGALLSLPRRASEPQPDGDGGPSRAEVRPR